MPVTVNPSTQPASCVNKALKSRQKLMAKRLREAKPPAYPANTVAALRE
jgi:hypothetical protein